MQIINYAPEMDTITIHPGLDQMIIVERDEYGDVYITIQDGNLEEERYVLGQEGIEYTKALKEKGEIE
jgi:hypothetical protein